MTEILPLLGAAATLGLGLMGLFVPSAAAAFTSLKPIGLLGRSEIRATYGGLFAAIGLYCLIYREPQAYTLAGCAWLGAAGGRLLSVVVDRSVSPKNLGGVLFEGLIGLCLLAPRLLEI